MQIHTHHSRAGDLRGARSRPFCNTAAIPKLHRPSSIYPALPGLPLQPHFSSSLPGTSQASASKTSIGATARLWWKTADVDGVWVEVNNEEDFQREVLGADSSQLVLVGAHLTACLLVGAA